jgi:hypothetical protein
MASRYVTVDRQGATPVARFDRTENLNAFNQELARDLTEVPRGWQRERDGDLPGPRGHGVRGGHPGAALHGNDHVVNSDRCCTR